MLPVGLVGSERGRGCRLAGKSCARASAVRPAAVGCGATDAAPACGAAGRITPAAAWDASSGDLGMVMRSVSHRAAGGDPKNSTTRDKWIYRA